ncbi:MAG: Omp28-related outer membrane protein [Bacteroidales bacterium]|nr:Omp28-related outer membrane protein [Bacteroidales bacterium]
MKKGRFFCIVALLAVFCMVSCEKTPDEPVDPYPIDQLTVGTEPQEAVVLIEEFTGVNCVNCPAGHRIANTLMAEHPGRVYAINIHQGPWAPRYRTEFGDSLALQAGIDGWPAATLNRKPYNGSINVHPNSWVAFCEQLLQGSSCANLAARAILDTVARTIRVQVKGYYTASAANSTNLLNVAVLEDSIIGPQSGGPLYNPEQITPDSSYIHTHMLRHLVTGQWGDEVSATTAGSTFEREYTWTVPAQISYFDATMRHFNILVFLAEGHKDIITCTKAELIFL